MLLAGVLGPWAIGSIDGRVVSICHCARLAARGAEAGVWTDPGFRGQGHAAAVVAAWASLLAPTGRHLFDSTFSENWSSQRVAARLGLRQRLDLGDLPASGCRWPDATPGLRRLAA